VARDSRRPSPARRVPLGELTRSPSEAERLRVRRGRWCRAGTGRSSSHAAARQSPCLLTRSRLREGDSFASVTTSAPRVVDDDLRADDISDYSPRPQRLPGCCAIRLARPVQGCGSACGSRDEPKAAASRQAWPRQHGFGITQLPPQFLVLQRHRDTLGVIDRSALIGGDREARHSHKRTSTRSSHAGRWVMIPP
jgi:hypothetical protein